MAKGQMLEDTGFNADWCPSPPLVVMDDSEDWG